MAAHLALAARRRRTAVVLGILVLIALATASILWPRPGPAQANPLTGVAAVSAGGSNISGSHTCAVTTAGGVKCWGNNDFRQLGDGTLTDRAIPVDVVGLGSGVAAVTAGGRHTCALTTAGGVKCWGWGYGTTLVDVVGLGSGVTAVAAGGRHTCALTAAGGVKCWGDNPDGQLGDGTTTSSTTPVDVTGLTTGATGVAAGADHTCALTTAGGVKCWGRNAAGQLGNGASGLDPNPNPVDVVGLTSGVATVAAGDVHTCALTTAGGVKCWGINAAGQLGDGQTCGTVWCTTAVDVVGLPTGVAAVDAGADHTCALTTGGDLKCWGYNGFGRLGDGTTTSSTTPVDVTGLTTSATAVTAGADHTCAVTTAGGVKCWGNNGFGQLGDGTTLHHTTPVDVIELGPKPTPTSTPCPPEGCPTPTATPPTAEMSLSVKGGDCDDPEKPAGCDVEAGSTFTLSVSVNSLPPPFRDGTPLDDGYTGIQSLVFYDGLVYDPTEFPADEIVWPDSSFPLRDHSSDGVVAHGDMTALLPPWPASTHVGNVVEISLTCSADAQRFELLLVSYSRPFGISEFKPLGALFMLADGFTIVPANTEEERNLDLDGDGELDPVMLDGEPFIDPETGEIVLINYGIADTLEINCVEPPAPTPTETPTPADTATPPQPPLEAKFDALRSAVDDLDVPPGLRNSLNAKIDDAARLAERRLPCTSATVLGAFINQVQALGRRRIPPSDASLLIAQAQGVIDQLLADVTCSRGRGVSLGFLEGDVEPDCAVDVLDQASIAFRWGAEQGSLLYSQRFDLEPSGAVKGDGDIDIKDLQFVFGRHGSACGAPHPPQPPLNPKG